MQGDRSQLTGLAAQGISHKYSSLGGNLGTKKFSSNIVKLATYKGIILTEITSNVILVQYHINSMYIFNSMN